MELTVEIWSDVTHNSLAKEEEDIINAFLLLFEKLEHELIESLFYSLNCSTTQSMHFHMYCVTRKEEVKTLQGKIQLDEKHAICRKEVDSNQEVLVTLCVLG